MRFFNLPDLGEGIPEADIVEWHIHEGDSVKEDQPMVSVETAKAIVEVPAPCSGVIARLCGQPGDTILTGAPLVEFVSDEENNATVVGKLASDDATDNSDESFIIGAAPGIGEQNTRGDLHNSLHRLAREFQVDVAPADRSRQPQTVAYPLERPEPLKGVRRHMARTMSQSHACVVPVTLFDDADIDHWPAGEDITIRLIQAIAVACAAEPALNAWFDGASESHQRHQRVNLGLAVDSEEGLFVPVLNDVASMSGAGIRQRINELRAAVKERSLANAALKGATITLSNFGMFAGKYATPIVVPPTVCIIGVGQLREAILSIDGQAVSHNVLPLSLSFDHRAVTGGEATRFLHAMMTQLQA